MWTVKKLYVEKGKEERTKKILSCCNCRHDKWTAFHPSSFTTITSLKLGRVVPGCFLFPFCPNWAFMWLQLVTLVRPVHSQCGSEERAEHGDLIVGEFYFQWALPSYSHQLLEHLLPSVMLLVGRRIWGGRVQIWLVWLTYQKSSRKELNDV